MTKALVLLFLAMAVPVSAQSVIQGPKCTGILHGVVYELSGQRAIGVRVVALPLGVQMGAAVPTVRTDQNGEYLFVRVCHGKYTVVPDDPEAGYPSTFEQQYEFLYGVRITAVRLNAFRERADLSVYLPPKLGRALLHVANAKTKSEILKFSVKLKVPGQHREPEESTEFDEITGDRELAIPSGKEVTVYVSAVGYKEASKSILVPPGTKTILNLGLKPLN